MSYPFTYQEHDKNIPLFGRVLKQLIEHAEFSEIVEIKHYIIDLCELCSLCVQTTNQPL